MTAERRSPARPLISFSVLALALVALAATAGGGVAAQDDGPCGIAPPPKPKRIKGGEGIPPLPLPATPLRRSERKRDPAPPRLIGKIRWGRDDRVLRTADGRSIRYADWNLDPNDVHRLLKHATAALGTKYRAEAISLEELSFDPRECPVLYAAGARPLRPPEAARDLLREYLRRGGFFLAVAHHGSERFASSIRELARELYPDRPLVPIPPDHAIYRAYRRIDRVRYSAGTRDRPAGAPWLEGLFIGCRVALVLSPYDLCCTWDSDHLPDRYPGVPGEDAFTLGTDILAYAVAYYPLGAFYGRWGLVEVEDPSIDRGDFVFAQIRHRGNYDPNPTAFAALLALATTETTLGARFRRELIPLTGPELLGHPFAYLTGHGDLRLSAAERDGLRSYLRGGGFLLADSCCGDLAFDVALRRELAAVIPGAKLEPLPPDHPIFSSFHPMDEVAYTTAVRASFPDLRRPFLEGLSVEGELAVVYSRFDLGNGWEGEEHPFGLGYRREDARRLGVNIIAYAMTR